MTRATRRTHLSWSNPFQQVPFDCPLFTWLPRYSRGVNAPLTLVSLPNAHEPNSYGVNSHTVAFSAMTYSPGSRLTLQHESGSRSLDTPTHSAAMMMGKGRLALPSAGTAEGSWEKVRLGEVSRRYCVGRRWLPRARPQ